MASSKDQGIVAAAVYLPNLRTRHSGAGALRIAAEGCGLMSIVICAIQLAAALTQEKIRSAAWLCANRQVTRRRLAGRSIGFVPRVTDDDDVG